MTKGFTAAIDNPVRNVTAGAFGIDTRRDYSWCCAGVAAALTVLSTTPNLRAEPAPPSQPAPPSTLQPAPPSSEPSAPEPVQRLQPAPPDAEPEPATYPPSDTEPLQGGTPAPETPVDGSQQPQLSPEPGPQQPQPGANPPQPYPSPPGPYQPQPYPAQPYPPPYPPQPYPRWGVPPPRAPHTKTGYNHDGVFTRLSLGVGYTKFTRSTPQVANDVSATGVTPALEVLAGGTTAPGLVLGGGLIVNAVPKPSYKLGGDPVSAEDSNFQLFVLPFFVNYYFDPKKGFNVQALAGFGFGAEVVTGVEQPGSEGIALGAGIGYESFVAKQWSLGVFGRFIYANLSSDENGVNRFYDVILPTISFVATLH